jgi:hypothetical protein
LQIADRTYAIAAPTHPLFLWHYARYAEIVHAQRDRLDERDRALVAEAAERLPFFLTSIFIPSTAFSAETNLIYLSRLGPLPYFGRETEGGASDNGLASVRALVEAQLALEPHSQRGYRLGLVDPPDAGAYLSMLADLADDRKLSGAHLTIYRSAITGPQCRRRRRLADLPVLPAAPVLAGQRPLAVAARNGAHPWRERATCPSAP